MISRIAAPAVSFRPVDHLRPDRVEVKVAAQLAEVTFIFHQLPLEPPLKQVTRAPVPSIEIARITAVKVLHPGRQIGTRSSDKEVMMVVHQHKSVQLPIVRLHRPLEPLQPPLAIAVVRDDISPLDPAGHHMIQGPFVLHSQWSGHGPSVTWLWPVRKTNH